MKKLSKISAIATVLLFIIWIISLLIYGISNMGVAELPNVFHYPLFIIIIYWSLFGLVYLIIERKAVKKFLIEFINE